MFLRTQLSKESIIAAAKGREDLIQFIDVLVALSSEMVNYVIWSLTSLDEPKVVVKRWREGAVAFFVDKLIAEQQSSPAVITEEKKKLIEQRAIQFIYDRLALFTSASFIEWFLALRRKPQLREQMVYRHLTHFFREQVKQGEVLDQGIIDQISDEFTSKKWGAETPWIKRFRESMQLVTVEAFLQERFFDEK